MPNSTTSSSSFSVIVGKSMFAPGSSILALSCSLMLFFTLTVISSSLTSVTSQARDPSAMRIFDPTETVYGRPSYEHAIVWLSPSSYMSVVITRDCPATRSTGLLSFRKPVIISIPLVSSMTPHCLSGLCFRAYLRLSMV